MLGSYVLKLATSGQHFFSLKAGNGQVILSSEMYESKKAAENGIASVQKNGTKESNFETRESKNGKPYFVLKASNGQEIGRSEMYESKSSCAKGIASVMRNALTTNTKDLTA